ncbi:hypothetical protein [Adhaeribacter terreus]|uniref:DUF4136 domain-containing protein n=1 Tax=Adhaeribacter terreus TaxID=529703 RepID=A0ABW0E8M0_9BACT
MKNLILIFLCFPLIILLQSCYTTSAYRTVGGNYYQYYGQDTTAFIQSMNKFAKTYPDLMLDSSFVNKKFRNKFDSKTEIARVFSGNKLYPLFPHKNYYGLYSWFIKSQNNKLIYEIGLFNCGFSKPKYNHCGFSLFNVYEQKDEKVKWIDLTNEDTKEYRKRREIYLKQFEAEMLPILNPNFGVK